MKNKFDFRKSQMAKVDEMSMDNQVKLLIKQLNQLQEDYYKKAYNVMNEIIRIRKRQIRGYGINDLHKEKGIELSSHSIQYIFGYRYLSGFTLEQIDKGNLKTSTALYIVRQNMKLREPLLQNRAIEAYINGKMNTCDLGIMGINALSKNVINDKAIEKADKDLNRIYITLEHILQKIKHRRDIFKNLKTINKIRGKISALDKELEDIANKLGK